MPMNYQEQIKSPAWQRKRLEIMQRDDFTCQLCKADDKMLNVHHLYYEPGKKIHEYDNEAMITLCDDCHECAHSYIAKVAGLIAWEVLKNGVPIIDITKKLGGKIKGGIKNG